MGHATLPREGNSVVRRWEHPGNGIIKAMIISRLDVVMNFMFVRI